MTSKQMERCRRRLEEFLGEMLSPIGRSERRHWGAVYVRGLLLNGERKSVGAMALRLPAHAFLRFEQRRRRDKSLVDPAASAA